MIYVDQRKGSVELIPYLEKVAKTTPVEKTSLEFGDVCFEGRGPFGAVAVGVERKALHDMLHCIDDARYSGHQRPGMKALYDASILIVEGHWRQHEDGYLMEGFNGGVTWGYLKYRTQRVMYAKLRRYLFSVQFSGVHVHVTRDIGQTAYDIHEWYQWFQKPWHQHTAMLETHKIAIPSLLVKPPLVKRWAADLEGIGVKLAEQAARVFKSPITLAQADELEWLRVPGVGVKTAQAIYREINGLRK